MKIIVKTLALAVALVAFGNVASAQKYGYMNSAALLVELPEMKAVEADLKGLESILKKEAEAKVAAFQAKVADYNQKKKNGLLTPRDEEKLVAELEKEQQMLYNLEQTNAAKMEAKQEELMKPILDKVNKALQEVAKEQGYLYIFDTQSGILLYADESADVTALVKAKL